MRIDNLAEKEHLFDKTLIDNLGRRISLVETIDLGDVFIKKLNIPSTGYFYKESTKKDMIVIHSTIGVLSGDISTLSKNGNPVSVSYLIGRNGIIYELFSPEYWAYHLGQGTISGNQVTSKRSIGIELCNMGPLRNNKGNLETIYSRQKITGTDGKQKLTAVDVYCSIDDTDYYVKLDTPFRGESYFCSYTPEQYKALNKLVRYLFKNFNIDMNYRTSPIVFTESEAKSFKGVCSHVNYRPNGKWDVGHDFNWGLITNDNIVESPIKEPIKLTPSTGLPPFLPTDESLVDNAKQPKSIFGGFLSRWIK